VARHVGLAQLLGHAAQHVPAAVLGSRRGAADLVVGQGQGVARLVGQGTVGIALQQLERRTLQVASRQQQGDGQLACPRHRVQLERARVRLQRARLAGADGRKLDGGPFAHLDGVVVLGRVALGAICQQESGVPVLPAQRRARVAQVVVATRLVPAQLGLLGAQRDPRSLGGVGVSVQEVLPVGQRLALAELQRVLHPLAQRQAQERLRQADATHERRQGHPRERARQCVEDLRGVLDQGVAHAPVRQAQGVVVDVGLEALVQGFGKVVALQQLAGRGAVGDGIVQGRVHQIRGRRHQPGRELAGRFALVLDQLQACQQGLRGHPGFGQSRGGQVARHDVRIVGNLRAEGRQRLQGRPDRGRRRRGAGRQGCGEERSRQGPKCSVSA
jgi:hypothetical protein